VVNGGGSYALLSNPLLTGTNAASQLLNGLNATVGGEIIYLWNGTGYYAYQYQGLGVGTGIGFQSDWTDGGVSWPAASSIPGAQTDSGNQVYWTPEPNLTNSQGFFIYNPNGNETNTFVGTVVTTNSLSIPGGGQYSLLGSAIPVSGDVTTNTAINLSANFGSSGGEIVYVWNGTGYYAYQYQGLGVGTGIGYQSDWTDGGVSWPAASTIPGAQTDSGDQVYWVPSPNLGVGQGFFIFNPNSNENWNQNVNIH